MTEHDLMLRDLIDGQYRTINDVKPIAIYGQINEYIWNQNITCPDVKCCVCVVISSINMDMHILYDGNAVRKVFGLTYERIYSLPSDPWFRLTVAGKIKLDSIIQNSWQNGINSAT